MFAETLKEDGDRTASLQKQLHVERLAAIEYKKVKVEAEKEAKRLTHESQEAERQRRFEAEEKQKEREFELRKLEATGPWAGRMTTGMSPFPGAQTAGYGAFGGGGLSVSASGRSSAEASGSQFGGPSVPVSGEGVPMGLGGYVWPPHPPSH